MYRELLKTLDEIEKNASEEEFEELCDNILKEANASFLKEANASFLKEANASFLKEASAASIAAKGIGALGKKVVSNPLKALGTGLNASMYAGMAGDAAKSSKQAFKAQPKINASKINNPYGSTNYGSNPFGKSAYEEDNSFKDKNFKPRDILPYIPPAMILALGGHGALNAKGNLPQRLKAGFVDPMSKGVKDTARDTVKRIKPVKFVDKVVGKSKKVMKDKEEKAKQVAREIKFNTAEAEKKRQRFAESFQNAVKNHEPVHIDVKNVNINDKELLEQIIKTSPDVQDEIKKKLTKLLETKDTRKPVKKLIDNAYDGLIKGTAIGAGTFGVKSLSDNYFKSKDKEELRELLRQSDRDSEVKHSPKYYANKLEKRASKSNFFKREVLPAMGDTARASLVTLGVAKGMEALGNRKNKNNIAQGKDRTVIDIPLSELNKKSSMEIIDELYKESSAKKTLGQKMLLDGAKAGAWIVPATIAGNIMNRNKEQEDPIGKDRARITIQTNKSNDSDKMHKSTEKAFLKHSFLKRSSDVEKGLSKDLKKIDLDDIMKVRDRSKKKLQNQELRQGVRRRWRRLP